MLKFVQHLGLFLYVIGNFVLLQKEIEKIKYEVKKSGGTVKVLPDFFCFAYVPKIADTHSYEPDV